MTSPPDLEAQADAELVRKVLARQSEKPEAIEVDIDSLCISADAHVTNRPAQPSPQSQEMLQVLQQAVAEALDKKQRLGQYAVAWNDGAPVNVGGEIEDMEVPFLLADKRFHEQQLLTLPESARLTRMSAVARIKSVDERLTQLASAMRLPPHDAQ